MSISRHPYESPDRSPNDDPETNRWTENRVRIGVRPAGRSITVTTYSASADARIEIHDRPASEHHLMASCRLSRQHLAALHRALGSLIHETDDG